MAIAFSLQADGFYRAYDGGLEIKLCNVGYEINLWEDQSDCDCEYDGCQSEDYDSEAECVAAHGGTCPAAISAIQQTHTERVMGLSSFEDVEKAVRSILKRRASWRIYPKSAALRFALHPWNYVERNRCMVHHS
jgi:hypothetical protein